MRLIDAEAFEKQIEKEITRLNTNAQRYFYNTGVKDHITVTVKNTFVIAKNWLNMQPTIEAKPVVHAHWEKISHIRYACSNCKGIDYYDDAESYKYCPYCGAQMDENHIAGSGKKEPICGATNLPCSECMPCCESRKENGND